MSSSVYVRRFIYSLKQGQTFTTKDVLKFGSRRAVDCTLKRLVEKDKSPDSLPEYFVMALRQNLYHRH
jgi:hypothetical protein